MAGPRLLRAGRNLYACAKAVAAAGGRFPESEEELRRLPGIGAYTAAAITAIAFARKATPVDGNVVRVIARLDAIETPLPAARPAIEGRARILTPERRAGDFAQAMMDLGATVCTLAPAALRGLSVAAGVRGLRGGGAGAPERYPLKAREKGPPGPPRRRLLAEERRWLGPAAQTPAQGLLGGMMEIPSSPWRAEPWSLAEALAQAALLAPAAADWRAVPGAIEHTFTHFHLEPDGPRRPPRRGSRPAAGGELAAGQWARTDRLDAQALPTVMKKIARHALGEAVCRNERAINRGRTAK